MGIKPKGLLVLLLFVILTGSIIIVTVPSVSGDGEKDDGKQQHPIKGPFKFSPLSESAKCGSLPLDAPFVLPEGFTQTVIEQQPNFPDLPDMNQMNERSIPIAKTAEDNDENDDEDEDDDEAKKARPGRFLYRTHEVRTSSSVSVTDLVTGETRILAQKPHWERFDGLKWTPWNTLLAAEEVFIASLPDPDFPQAQSGLVYEIDPVTGDAVVRPALGSLAHEGIGIDKKSNVYVIDETREGSIYKFVPDKKKDLASGKLFALKIINDGSAPGERTGDAKWIELDQDLVKINARDAAVAVGATKYNRPEDVDIIKNTLYVAITSEQRVLAISLKGNPFVTEFVKAGVNAPAENAGRGIDGFHSPDNLAVDRARNLWIAEDNKPGDIWVATPDRNKDGYADDVLLFASLSDCTAEPSGIFFGVGKEKNTLFVNVMHAGGPDSIDLSMAITKKHSEDK